MRIDKWLWAVRLFKTRSAATEACKKGRVRIDQESVKPSRTISMGDIIEIRKPPIIKSFRVKGLLEKRVSAKIAAENVEDLTPEEELIMLKSMKNSAYISRERGLGRPTKKERRILDNIFLKQKND
ncbi:RNA-binding S4 domain-containing protein [Bacteroidota bacterium]